MRRYEVCLVEWPEDGAPAPRLLGRTAAPDVVADVRDRIASQQIRLLADVPPCGPRALEAVDGE